MNLQFVHTTVYSAKFRATANGIRTRTGSTLVRVPLNTPREIVTHRAKVKVERSMGPGMDVSITSVEEAYPSVDVISCNNNKL